MNIVCAKRFLRVFLPILLLELGLGWLFYGYEADLDLRSFIEADRHALEQQALLIENELGNIRSDLRFLQESDALKDYLANPRDASSLVRLFWSLADSRAMYDQIRVLDGRGKEQVRVNYQNGLPHAVSQEALQDKSNRPYFTEAMTLGEGEIYVSPLELNMEQGALERPFKPVLRVATPLFIGWDTRRGVLVLNYLGEQLLKRIWTLDQALRQRVYLLNSQGWWLYSNREEQTWGFMLNERQGQRFSLTYPKAWQVMSRQPSGRFEGEEGVFVWHGINSLAKMRVSGLANAEDVPKGKGGEDWILVSYHSMDSISALLSELRLRTGLTLLALVLVSGLVTYKFVEGRMRLQTARESEALLNEAKFFTNYLLRGALTEDHTLEEEMQAALEMILGISWVSLLAKGSIFLLDEERNELVMVAQKDLARPLLTLCARLRMGQCLCGRAAQSREILFTNCLDHQHEIRFEGMSEHGHICVPILRGEQLLGVINLYVAHGHQFKPLYKEQMTSIANAMAEVIERRKLDQRLRQAMAELTRQKNALEHERSIVEDVLARIRAAEAFDGAGIRYLMESVDKTAGDLLLAARRPDGVHHYLLGDFTGHGLPSALASPTVADIFYSMTLKGLTPEVILLEINAKLYEKLPAHLYFAACFVELNRSQARMRLWNSGLPDQLLLRQASPWRRMPSSALPLGIIDEWEATVGEPIQLQPGDRIFSFTDGVVEISNSQQELFGLDRLEAELCRITGEGLPLEALVDSIAQYHGSSRHLDDITLLEITIG